MRENVRISRREYEVLGRDIFVFSVLDRKDCLIKEMIQSWPTVFHRTKGQSYIKNNSGFSQLYYISPSGDLFRVNG